MSQVLYFTQLMDDCMDGRNKWTATQLHQSHLATVDVGESVWSAQKHLHETSRLSSNSNWQQFIVLCHPVSSKATKSSLARLLSASASHLFAYACWQPLDRWYCCNCRTNLNIVVVISIITNSIMIFLWLCSIIVRGCCFDSRAVWVSRERWVVGVERRTM